MSHPLFGIHGAALQLQARRMEMISGNLANADTPGYRAQDLDFQSTLEAMASDRGKTARTTNAVEEARTIYRTVSPALDENTVDMAREQAAFADATLRYEAALRFVDGRISGLMTAIRGQ
ncbi:flagellar basal body rod protein FlgB [Algiphilus sp.]|uniref:flagellar basal body rod protein FlgB n=2 Tax=Algiphilus sp. TaxID=1872431 RepID=UPI001CA6040F|nr:flagellar basal body rod protein FlgB [Algiphilus sp.]MBY8967009.1 flagellar basal body rod protein FlgB [Algiphilus acroporae]MCR9091385.1 flagellar basal body rod protein FlgB [Pseudomonadota bacterium]